MVRIAFIFSDLYDMFGYKRLTIKNSDIAAPARMNRLKNYSTIHALNTAVSQLVNALNNGEVMFGIFLDFSSAFDTILHNILITKLEHYGIRGKALDLIANYLSEQYV